MKPKSAVVVFEQDQDNMVSDWTDRIVVTRSKSGHYGVVLRKFCRPFETSRHKSWVNWEQWRAERDVAKLTKALRDAESSVCLPLDWSHVIAKIATIHWMTAVTVACKMEMEWPAPRQGQVHAELSTAAPHDVEQLLQSVRSWEHEVLLDVLRHLHARTKVPAPGATEGLPTAASPKRSGTARPHGSHRAWRCAERRLFGDPSLLLSRHPDFGLGFRASLIEGPNIDLFALAGFRSADLQLAVQDRTNWCHLVDLCPSAKRIEVGAQDGPGISDALYWVAVQDPVALAQELREAIVSFGVARRPRA